MVKYEYFIYEINVYKFPDDGKFYLNGSHNKEVIGVRLEAKILRNEYDNNGLLYKHVIDGIKVSRKDLTQGECEVLFTAFNHDSHCCL